MNFHSARALLCSLGLGLAFASGGAAQSSDEIHFDWPLGREDVSGSLAMGHDVDVQQNYGNYTHPQFGPRPHAGVDLWWIPRKGESWGTSTVGAPVFAAADGEVICEKEDNYPGRVVVIEHHLSDGRTIYSQYGHLQTSNTDPEAVVVGTRVKRGEKIARVLDQGGNSHLHFEIRLFGYDPVSGSCAGPGYGRRSPPRLDRNGRELSPEARESIARGFLAEEDWIDPAYFYYTNRPLFPRLIVLWSLESRNVRSARTTENGDVLGELAPSSRLLAYGVRRGTNRLDWWYRIRWNGRWAWVNAFRKGTYGSSLAIGELTDTALEWQPAPLIEYRFDEPGPFARGLVLNRARPGGAFNGTVHGNAELVPGPRVSGRSSNRALGLDGDTAFVEVAGSETRGFENGVVVSAMVRRDTNKSEDAILSKWYGGDQWLLTFYPGGAGRLIFTVRLGTGAYVSAEYLLPDENYLERWAQVDARYDIVVNESSSGPHGLLRLYWGGVLVASRRVEDQPLGLWPSRSRIHVGDAGPGTSWSRFQGAIDEVRISRSP